MELFAKKKLKQTMFYSFNKIAAVKARQEKLRTQKELGRLTKETNIQHKIIEKEQKF